MILFFIALKLFFLPTLHPTEYLFRPTVISGIRSLYHEKLSSMQHILRVNRVTCTFTKRKIIDGIQQISLTHTVLPKETVQFGRKSQISLLNVLIIQYGDAV